MRREPSFITREPLAVFLVLGIALYLLTVLARPDTPSETIVVPEETLRALVQQSEELLGRPLGPHEIVALVESHVDDEVLLREARARGFDRNDGRVRQRLLNVMRAALDEPVAAPSVAELEAYYRDNSDRLRSSPAFTFEHVYFGWGAERVPDEPDAFIATLEASDDATAFGEPFMPGFRQRKVDRSRVVLLFGPEFADVLPTLDVGVWTGPIESRTGVHYVRVLEHHPSELMPFESLESYLQQEWMLERRRATQQNKVEKLRTRYRIELPASYRNDEGAS